MAKRAKRIAVAGASGSIGRQTLDVCRAHPDRLKVCLIAVHSQVAPLDGWCREFQPEAVCVTDARAAQDFQAPAGTQVYAGAEALSRGLAAHDFDLLVNAVVGAAGLRPSFDALLRGRSVATANKESLVIAGELLTATARASGASILPIDSEHSAIWQCLRSGRREEVEEVWLTGSGGPFRTRPLESFDTITVEQALGHPTWNMGAKITIDSATMMNKGFEIIEARWLFDFRPEQIRVVVHPESIVHSAVAYRDGSIIAQLGHPDMRHPIAYALLYPERLGPAPRPLDLRELGGLHFEPPDPARFRALDLADRALRRGGHAPVILNAANEIAVHAFLEEQIRFPRITECVAESLEGAPEEHLEAIDDIYQVDRHAREKASEWIAAHRIGN